MSGDEAGGIDRDVDLDDFTLFIKAMTGPQPNAPDRHRHTL